MSINLNLKQKTKRPLWLVLWSRVTYSKIQYERNLPTINKHTIIKIYFKHVEHRVMKNWNEFLFSAMNRSDEHAFISFPSVKSHNHIEWLKHADGISLIKRLSWVLWWHRARRRNMLLVHFKGKSINNKKHSEEQQEASKHQEQTVELLLSRTFDLWKTQEWLPLCVSLSNPSDIRTWWMPFRIWDYETSHPNFKAWGKWQSSKHKMTWLSYRPQRTNQNSMSVTDYEYSAF